jgi:biopolymer transport protein ExbD
LASVSVDQPELDPACPARSVDVITSSQEEPTGSLAAGRCRRIVAVPLKSLPLDEPGINLTSMLDVVMLLIIFFMLGTQFKEEERQYDIALPTVAEVGALTGQPDEIVVNILESGQIVVGPDTVTMPELTQRLQAAREQFPGQAVVIRGDGRGAYQPVMDVMSACRTAGIRQISLAHRPGATTP